MLESTQVNYDKAIADLDDSMDEESQRLLFNAAQEAYRYRATPAHKVTLGMNVGCIAYYIIGEDPPDIKTIPAKSLGYGVESHSERNAIKELISTLKLQGFKGTDKNILSNVKMIIFTERSPCDNKGDKSCDKYLEKLFDPDKHKVYYVEEYEANSKSLMRHLGKQIQSAANVFDPGRTFTSLQQEISAKKSAPKRTLRSGFKAPQKRHIIEEESIVVEPTQPQRTGLKSLSNEALSSLFLIPDEFTVGKAIDDGDCFFDSLAQILNDQNPQANYDAKQLRMRCYQYYCDNEEIVNQWNQADHTGTVRQDEYALIQHTTSEMDEDYDRAPIWGRPHVEGRMLVDKLGLEGLHLIEIYDGPDGKVVQHSLITKEGVRSIPEGELPLASSIPTLVLTQEDRHFVPIVSRTFAANYSPLPIEIRDTTVSAARSGSRGKVTREQTFDIPTPLPDAKKSKTIQPPSPAPQTGYTLVRKPFIPPQRIGNRENTTREPSFDTPPSSITSSVPAPRVEIKVTATVRKPFIPPRRVTPASLSTTHRPQLQSSSATKKLISAAKPKPQTQQMDEDKSPDRSPPSPNR